MRFLIYYIVCVICCVACGEPEPRRPVTVKSGQFLKASVARNKKLLAQEERMIQDIIQKDTLHEYHASPNGFWYYFETKNDTASYRPQPYDRVQFSYTLMTLQNDTLYSAETLGLVSYIVDKETLFPGLQQAIKLLKVKEKATFLFPSSQAYGYPGDGRAIGPNTPIQCAVALHTLQIHHDSLTSKYNVP